MKNFRSQVFKKAHEIKARTNQTFSACLTLAWKVYRLIKKGGKSAKIEVLKLRSTLLYLELKELKKTAYLVHEYSYLLNQRKKTLNKILLLTNQK